MYQTVASRSNFFKLKTAAHSVQEGALPLHIPTGSPQDILLHTVKHFFVFFCIILLDSYFTFDF